MFLLSALYLMWFYSFEWLGGRVDLQMHVFGGGGFAYSFQLILQDILTQASTCGGFGCVDLRLSLSFNKSYGCDIHTQYRALRVLALFLAKRPARL